MRQAQTLIMVVVFIVFAALIGLTLAMMVGGSLMMPKYSYNTELAFYAADAGLARALKIISDYPDWYTVDPLHPSNNCCKSSPPSECCSFLSHCSSHYKRINGKCYLREMYYINPGSSSKRVYYIVYREKGKNPHSDGGICSKDSDICKP